MDKCKIEPRLESKGQNHTVSCYLYDKEWNQKINLNKIN
jgi:hypothetical protein